MQDANVVVVGMRGWDGWRGGVTNVRADDRTLAGDFGAHPHTPHQTSTLNPVLAPTPILLEAQPSKSAVIR